jgi:hypothetical protein
MKARNSLRKATWSVTRESHYRSMCDQLLFSKNQSIIISGQKAFLKSVDKEEFFLEIEDEKTAWYRIWCKLMHGW